MNTEMFFETLYFGPVIMMVLSWIFPKAIQRYLTSLGALGMLALVVMGKSLADQPLHWDWTLMESLGVRIAVQWGPTQFYFTLMAALGSFVAVTLEGSWYRRYPKFFSTLAFLTMGILNLAMTAESPVLFYVAFEAIFIPMILMVGVWGGVQKATATFRFFLMSFLGSVLLMIAILSYLFSVDRSGLSEPAFFLLLSVAFLIKIPVFPFHGWLKQVYTVAPMPATIWMSAVLSKLGVYGWMMFVWPLAQGGFVYFQETLMVLATVSILYPALLAYRAQDPKSVLAYSSISHLGFVALALFLNQGSADKMVIALCLAHTMTGALLFGLYSLIEPYGFELKDALGLSKKFPFFSVLFGVATFASVSVPGTFNFIGEIQVLVRTYSTSVWIAVLAGMGIVFGVTYSFRLFQRLHLGAVNETATRELNSLGWDLLTKVTLTVLSVLVLALGFVPSWIGL